MKNQDFLPPGKILAELHAQKSPSMELEGFKVDRF